MRVVYFNRYPAAGYFSIERVFDQVIDALPATVECVWHQSRHARLSPFSFVANIGEAWLRRDEINHVTGDIHYVNLLLDRRRTVLTVHDCNILTNNRGLKRRIIKGLWYDLPIRKSRFVTTVSHFTARQLVEYCPHAREKVIVIHDPLDARFTPCPRPFAAKPVILQVGTAWNKNLERVAEALHGIDCTLSIIGRLSAEQRSMLERSGLEYRNACNLSDDALRDAYRACDLVLFASIYEGFGMPIIEAQATGRPVITSDCTAMPEIAGQGACLVDPFDSGSIRTGVLRVIRNAAYRGALINAGYENVKRFDAATIARQYLHLYEQIQLSFIHPIPSIAQRQGSLHDQTVR